MIHNDNDRKDLSDTRSVETNPRVRQILAATKESRRFVGTISEPQSGFEQRIAHETREIVVAVARGLRYVNLRTVADAEYSYIYDVLERDTERQVDLLIDNSTGTLKNIFCEEPTGAEIIAKATKEGDTQEVAECSPEVADRIKTELIPLLKEFGGEQHDISLKNNREQEVARRIFTVMVAEHLGITIVGVQSIEVHTLLDENDIGYIIDIFSDNRDFWKNFFSRLPFTPDAARSKYIFYEYESRVRLLQSDPRVRTMHLLMSQAHFLSYRTPDETVERQRAEELFFEDIARSIENGTQSTDIKRLEDGYDSFVDQYITPYFHWRRQAYSQFANAISDEAFQSDYDFDTLEKSLTIPLPIGLERDRISIRFYRQFFSQEPNVAGRVLGYGFNTAEIISQLMYLPIEAIFQRDFDRLRLLAQEATRVRRYSLLWIHRHEYIHLWENNTVHAIVQKTGIHESQVLGDLGTFFILFLKNSQEEIRKKDIFTEGVGKYDMTLLGNSDDIVYIREVLAETGSRLVLDKNQREQVREKMPGHYGIFRSMHDLSLNEVFREAFAAFVQTNDPTTRGKIIALFSAAVLSTHTQETFDHIEQMFSQY